VKSLVTGAGGFIGGHLAKALLARGDEVVCADRKPLPIWKQLHPDALNLHAELGDRSNARNAAQGCDTVYHLAAESGGMGFISTHKADCTLSILADANVLRAAKDAGARIFYASSACIYPLSLQQAADAPDLAEWMAYDPKPEPEEAYGWEKLFAERMYLAHAEDYGMQVRIARFQSVYGPRGVYKGGREKAPTAICRKVATAKLTGEGSVEVWGDGTAVRTFTYIDDCVSGILAVTAGDYGQPLNIGSDETMSVAELVDTVEDIAGYKVARTWLDGPDARPLVGVPGRRGCDTTLVREKTGWSAKVSNRKGLERTYAWVYGEVKNELGA
jgi:nucleoside-diphosphate-sugar epimerase